MLTIRLTYCLSIFVIGCDADTAPDAGAARRARDPALVGPSGCFDPASYGGVPDDEGDDRAAIQSAIDDASSQGAGRICLGDGRWKISRAPAGSYNRFAGLTIHSPKVELSGNGAGTIIDASGDQGGGAMFVISLDPGARNVILRDFVLDTSGMTNTSEQTHAIQLGGGVGVGPVEDIRFERIIFNHPQPPGTRKGDCLRMVGGQAPNQVRRVTIIGSTFPACARSGIAIQRGVYDLVIMGNQFTQAGDQDIDSEPTSSGGNSGLSIIGNIFRDDVTLTQDDWSVTIGGYDDPMNGVTLSGNIFEGRGIDLNNSANTVVSGNTFSSTMETGYGVINFGSRAETIVLNGNTMRRRGFDGPMIRVVHAASLHAQNVTISNNEMVQETRGGGIVIESADKMSVVNNGIQWIQSAPSAYGIYLRSTVAGAAATMISSNRMVGSVKYGIYLGAAPNPFTTASVVGNMTTGAATSLGCDQTMPNNFKQPIVFAVNNFNSLPQCVATLVTSRP